MLLFEKLLSSAEHWLLLVEWLIDTQIIFKISQNLWRPSSHFSKKHWKRFGCCSVNWSEVYHRYYFCCLKSRVCFGSARTIGYWVEKKCLFKIIQVMSMTPFGICNRSLEVIFKKRHPVGQKSLKNTTKCFRDLQRLSNDQRLAQLNLHFLEERRHIEDEIENFKIIYSRFQITPIFSFAK